MHTEEFVHERTTRRLGIKYLIIAKIAGLLINLEIRRRFRHGNFRKKCDKHNSAK